ncbi:MAG: hypothetical protein C0504_15290 [Candidatus Solibacter sp.]|nr:hypothetical protein [Candidatus Solibacter sp.]
MTDREAKGLKRLKELADQLAGAAAEAGFSSLTSQTSAGKAASGGGETAASSLSAAVSRPISTSSTSGETGRGRGKTQSPAAGVLANLNPIVAGLMKLFGGGSDDQAQTMTKIERPAGMRYQGVVSERAGWGITEMDYAADGRPRMVERAAQTPVVVQVQAMDSRSFLDHRDEIASAVRQALLESHGLGEVMREV